MGSDKELCAEVSAEIHRIQHALIASLGHPSTAGAFHWAGLAMERFQRRRATADRLVKAALSTVAVPG